MVPHDDKAIDTLHNELFKHFKSITHLLARALKELCPNRLSTKMNIFYICTIRYMRLLKVASKIKNKNKVRPVGGVTGGHAGS